MDQQTIFITGAASGIGRATAELFHSHGWFVGGYDLDARGLDELAELFGDGGVAGVLDVTDKEAFDTAIGSFGERTGDRLDLLFNNAGIAVGGMFDDVPFEKSVATVHVNLLGVLNGVHAAIPLLRDTPNSMCFTTSSSASTFGTPGLAVYSATKYAVKGLTEALSVELARYGSRAADVMPGIIDTPLWGSAAYGPGEAERQITNLPAANAGRTDALRTMSADAVAECVWEAYHSDCLHWYVPPEVVDRDRAAAIDPEALRDELIGR